MLNPANINRGANHLAEGETADSLASREKIRLSVQEWGIIKTAMEHGTPIPGYASKNMLLGYHYALRQQSKQLAEERIKIQKRKESAIAASIAYHKARSDASYTNSKRHHRHRSRFENLEHSERQSLSKISTRSSYRSTSKVTSYQKRQKQRSWQHKHIDTQRGQVQETQESICIELHDTSQMYL
jgi:hypothetical protein